MWNVNFTFSKDGFLEKQPEFFVRPVHRRLISVPPKRGRLLSISILSWCRKSVAGPLRLGRLPRGPAWRRASARRRRRLRGREPSSRRQVFPRIAESLTNVLDDAVFSAGLNATGTNTITISGAEVIRGEDDPGPAFFSGFKYVGLEDPAEFKKFPATWMTFFPLR